MFNSYIKTEIFEAYPSAYFGVCIDYPASIIISLFNKFIIRKVNLKLNNLLITERALLRNGKVCSSDDYKSAMETMPVM